MFSQRLAWFASHEGLPGWRGILLEFLLIGLTAVAWCCAFAQLLQLPFAPGSWVNYGHPLPSYLGPWALLIVGYAAGLKLNRGRFAGIRERAIATALVACSGALWALISFRAWRYPLASWATQQSWIALPILCGALLCLVGVAWAFGTNNLRDYEGYKHQLTRASIVYAASLAIAPWLNWLFRMGAESNIQHAQRWSLGLLFGCWIAVLGLASFRDMRDDSARLHVDLPAWRRAGFSLARISSAAGLVGIVMMVLLGHSVTEIFALVAKLGLGVLMIIGAAIAALIWAYLTLIQLLIGTPADKPAVTEFMPPDLSSLQGHSSGSVLGIWIGLGIVLFLLVSIALALFGVRFTRRSLAAGSHESIYSAGLLGQQLRALFPQRSPSSPALRRIHLAENPATARAAMLYLSVLAKRCGFTWRDGESARDFIHRLRLSWYDVGSELEALLAAYEPERYGHAPASTESAASWNTIWKAHHA